MGEETTGVYGMIDVDEATAALRAAGPGGTAGRRQKTLLRDGGVTVALFLFDAGAALDAHKAPGAVVIHVLDGRLRVNAGGRAHDLTAGRLLVLAPGAVHDVTADAPSRMLLTIHAAPSRGA